MKEGNAILSQIPEQHYICILCLGTNERTKCGSALSSVIITSCNFIYSITTLSVSDSHLERDHDASICRYFMSTCDQFMHKIYNGLVLAVVYMKLLWKLLSAYASKSNTRKRQVNWKTCSQLPCYSSHNHKSSPQIQ